jgi:hypothetical protein
MSGFVTEGYRTVENWRKKGLELFGIDPEETHFIEPVINGKYPMKFVDTVWFTINRIMAIVFIVTFFIAVLGILVVIIEHFVCEPDQESLVIKVKRSVGEVVAVVNNKFIHAVRI